VAFYHPGLRPPLRGRGIIFLFVILSLSKDLLGCSFPSRFGGVPEGRGGKGHPPLSRFIGAVRDCTATVRLYISTARHYTATVRVFIDTVSIFISTVRYYITIVVKFISLVGWCTATVGKCTNTVRRCTATASVYKYRLACFAFRVGAKQKRVAKKISCATLYRDPVNPNWFSVLF